MPIPADQTSTQHKVLLVTGMHRSATSTLMRICNLLGIRSPGTNLGPGPDNPLGFWEPVEIVHAHDVLLNELGRAWNDSRSLPPGWLNSAAAERCRARIIDLVRRDCGELAVWGLKDPRLCRFLPLWIPIIESMGAKPYILHLFREPDQVAGSLRHRADAMGSPHGYDLSVSEPYRLWLTYVMDAERDSRSYPRAFISYDALLADWRGVMTSAAQRMGFQWPVQPDEAAESVNAFLDQGRRHQRDRASQAVEQTPAAEAARALYQVLREAAAGDEQALVAYVDTYGKQHDIEVNQSMHKEADIQRLLQTAAAHVQGGHLQEAETEYEQVLALQANNPFALHVLGLLKYQKGDAQRAVDLMEQAIAAKPDFAEACNNVATIYAELEQLDNAVAKYLQAIAIAPGMVEAHYNLGAIYQTQNRLEDAIKHYQDALALKPDLIEARDKIAEVSQLIGQGSHHGAEES